MVIKAVVFDIGGVCVGSPLHAINEYEKSLRLPHNYLNFMIAKWKSPSPMNLLECGQIATIEPEFFTLFERHLSDPEGYEAFFGSPFCPKDAVKDVAPTIDGRKLWGMMMEAASVPNTPLLDIIRDLKASGKYKVWALTNNFPAQLETDSLIHPLFDRIIGSVQMKMRKPDPRLYQYLVEELDLPTDEIVFLDDIGANLKAAQKLGIHTIQVDFRTTPVALKKLNHLLESGGVKAQL
ncbi:putative Epoxide hydrolase [Taphrina deformans PYCC 5710]|uniref:Epoxide hydrolase n=1 Tax=Taphrina deformans (strain PYCC 5710 / ATCC 11124 / CBS 356.35 / IMI 108563 / JCM 9778 / NBRC 8474) TaxID=1097556 RepID=R4XA29_TAPDE|nr:putative Epoxide hydrolase [Taphrina deformans PYCC 5710]|eukprot:CCG82643.1 putative Epoxide hydrolase [Taphrina deformans PYCC 5710]